MPVRLAITLLLTSLACAPTGGGPGFGAETVASGGEEGSACDPNVANVGCYGTFVMTCGPSRSWSRDQACPMGMMCSDAAGDGEPVCVQMGAADGAAADGGSADVGSSATPQELACERWAADRVDLSEGKWSGNVAACKPGELSEQAIDNSLRLVNLYRHFAGLPAVVDDPDLNSKAQACSLIMAANKSLSHTPPSNWKCWTQVGAAAAKKSNISTAAGVRSVDRYVIDSGANNAATMGHRRWILSRSLGPIGVGSTVSGASCLHVIGGSGKVAKAWTAWPSPGPLPVAAMRPYKGGNVDVTGWTVQSDTINVTNATVKVSSDGAVLQVTSRKLQGGYGSKYAIAFVPKGWASAAGRTYTVEIGGIATPFSYVVEMLGCK